MNKTLFNVLLFTSGAVVGSLVTWKVLKTTYERITQEEIDSVKETWARLQDADVKENRSFECRDDDEDQDEYDPEANEMIGYTRLASRYSRTSDADTDAEKEAEGGGDNEVPYINGPYVIEPNDFANGNYDHDCYCITYYADGILADDWGVILDIDDTIGLDAIKHFGDYAEDVVHVRNERLKADYEIARDPRNYADVIANDPLLRSYAD